VKRLKNLVSWFKRLFMVPGLFALLLVASGCSGITVLDPKGPVARTQQELIIFSITLMSVIVIVVFVLFFYMIIRFRERPNWTDKDYDPHQHGNTTLEIIWTVIPFIIVTALSVPTVTSIYALEEAPEGTENQEPLVIYADTSNWKWYFSYPEQNIETVNYLHIPENRPIEFKLASADSMTALWIPALGGQKYNMAGMQNTLYLQADEEGEFAGRNANYNGSGFAEHTFTVTSESEEEFNQWVSGVQNNAPELTEERFNKYLEPGLAQEAEYSSTHLEYVNFGVNSGQSYITDLYSGELGEQLHLEGGEGGPWEQE
jgi:cytochrome aa3-600 menaquinol oxidase subunit 2